MNRLIVFLNNNDVNYKDTFHNVAVDFLHFFLKNQKSDYIFTRTVEKDYFLFSNNKNKNKLLVPRFYMNDNGKAIRSFINKDPKHNLKYKVFVVFDDIFVDFGSFKLNDKSGSKAHNGIKSVISVTPNFFRLRIGIGKSDNNEINNGLDLNKYVTSKLSMIEKNKILEVYDKMIEVMKDIISDENEKTIISKSNHSNNKKIE